MGNTLNQPTGMGWNELVSLCQELSSEDFVRSHPGPFLVQVPDDHELPPYVPGQVERRLTHILRALNPDARVHSLAPRKGPGEPVVIGRAGGQNDVVLDCSVVSKRHAEVLRPTHRWRLMDLESANGTFLEQDRLRAGVAAIMESGQALRFTSYRAAFLSAEHLHEMASRASHGSTSARGARKEVERPTTRQPSPNNERATARQPQSEGVSGEPDGNRTPSIPPSGMLWRELEAEARHVPLDPFLMRYPGPFLVELGPRIIANPLPWNPKSLEERVNRLKDSRDLDATRIHHLGSPEPEKPRVLGRAGCDIELGNSDTSRRHAQFVSAPDYTLTDLESANGTIVEGSRTRAATLVEPGQILSFSSYRGILLRSETVHEMIFAGIKRTADPRRVEKLRAALETPPQGVPLRQLVKAIGTLERGQFLTNCPARFLLQIPVDEKPPEGQQAVEPELNGTQPFSRSEVLGLKRGKQIRMAHVHVIFPPESGNLTIGRGAGCEVVLPEGTVSKEHATLVVGKKEWGLIDLESHNGTWIEGERIPAGVFAPLSPGITVCFSSYLGLWLDPEMIHQLLSFVHGKKTQRRKKKG